MPAATAPEVAPAATAGGGGAGAAGSRRPGLDGVRALAVLSVVVYHFGGGSTSWLRGGYLGVDVFFVLSGYLITGLLLAEHARSGTISLVRFWVRRVKRLAPALFLMLLVVVAWLWWATPPSQYPARRQDVFWTLGYLANWHLAAGSDSYFAAYNGASPLRHAWSLAIEEQFYLVWPATVLLLMWLGTRFRWTSPRRLVAGFALVAGVASAVALAVLYEPTAPSVAYFSTRGRVQELFAGVLLAVFLAGRRPVGRRLQAAAVVGLAALLVALVLLPDQAALYYYGGAAGVSLAAVLLIAGVEADPSSRLARAFSWRPAVLLGRISYGVYLWHWPVVVAVPLSGSLTDRVLQQEARVVLTLGLSIASFYLLERPVQRSRRVLGTAPRALVAVLATAGLVVAATVPATALPGTVSKQLSISADRGCPGERDDRLLYCVWPSGSAGSAAPAAKAAPATGPSLAIMGDSTARSLTPGLDDWARAHGTSWVETAWKRCSATGLLIRAGAELDLPATTCHQQARAQITRMLDRYRPRTVLISEFWVHHQPLVLPDGSELMPGTPAHDVAVRAAFLQVVDEIAAHGGRAVFLELAPPGEPIGRQLARGRPAGTAAPDTPGARYVAGFNAVLRSVVAARPRVASTVSVTDLLCPDGRCLALRGDLVVRVDGVHYSIPFAKKLVPVLLQRAGVTP